MASIRQWFRHQRLQLGEWLYWRRQAEARTRKAGLPVAPLRQDFCGPGPAKPRASSCSGAEKLVDLAREQLGLLERREVAAARHRRPAPDVVGARRKGPRRPQDLARELCVAGGDIDRFPVRDRPGAVHARVIGPERRADRAGEPVERHVGEKVVAAHGVLDLAAAVAPGPELLDDPGGQPGRRIGEPVGERLRLGALDPLVAGLFLQPVRELRQVARLSSGVGSRACAWGRAAPPAG